MKWDDGSRTALRANVFVISAILNDVLNVFAGQDIILRLEHNKALDFLSRIQFPTNLSTAGTSFLGFDVYAYEKAFSKVSSVSLGEVAFLLFLLFLLAGIILFIWEFLKIKILHNSRDLEFLEFWESRTTSPSSS